MTNMDERSKYYKGYLQDIIYNAKKNKIVNHIKGHSLNRNISEEQGITIIRSSDFLERNTVRLFTSEALECHSKIIITYARK